MYKRTLRAGIIVGSAGLVITLFSSVFLQNFGTVTFSGTTSFSSGLTQIYLLTLFACLAFSAALVSAALVMRHLDAAGDRQADRQPLDERRT
ncbi:hypothetical protein CVS28_16815 [Arthrobacter glacialis]|uniref:Uncharacterized protein n=1 Tax=Arthrobacter glacialis TaxID=1664 RepID=A0A2S3ZT58_ARTGL|nr:hypothetical protein CVS28_16815 [Arthrobacter glacialis]POH72400.1 hypothetical protein CVS27_16070 [Arthrobacter glacialis]